MNKREREKLENALLQKEFQETKKRNTADYFKHHAKRHIEWLKELVRAYKAKNSFPLLPSLLAEYYTNSRDIETALLMTICIKWDSDSVYRQVQELKKILGDTPYLWLRNGEYKTLGLPRNQHKKVEGSRAAKFWKVSQIAESICHMCEGEDGFLTFEDAFTKANNLPTVADNLCVEYSLGEKLYKGRLLDLVFRTTDGVGRGMWSVPDGYKLLCPYSKDIGQFLKTWFPFYYTKDNLFPFDEAVSLFGFDRDYDFFYAYLGWKELCKRNPEGCAFYVRKYSSWYKNGSEPRPCIWRETLPEIIF